MGLKWLASSLRGRESEIGVRHTTSCYFNGRDDGISDFQTWKMLMLRLWSLSEDLSLITKRSVVSSREGGWRKATR